MKQSTRLVLPALFLALTLVPPSWADLTIVRPGSDQPTQWSRALDAARTEPARAAVANTVKYREKAAQKQVALKALEREKLTSLRLLNHANIPLKVMMGLIPRTLDEVQAMLAVVKAVNEEENLPQDERLKLHLVCDSPETFRKLAVSQEDFDRYVEVNRDFHMTSSDVWLQDWGEVAVVATPGEKKEQLMVLDTNRGRASLGELPAVLAKLWSGYFYKKPTANLYSCGDYGGNIEVTPDGVLVLGTTSSEELRGILDAGYKGNTALLDTEWLIVGHVDEYVTTIPNPASPRGYTIVKADPALGLERIAKLPREQFAAEMSGMVAALNRGHAQHAEGVTDSKEVTQSQRVFATLHAYHAQANGYAVDLSTIAPVNASSIEQAVPKLIEDNRKIKATIDAQVAKLIAQIQATSGDPGDVPVVSLPALFEPFNGSGKTVAMLPGAANMVVLRNHVVVPDPLLPALRADIAATLAGIGAKAHFIADASYHFYQGQLHCGTNVLRHPNRYVVDPARRPVRTRLFQELFH